MDKEKKLYLGIIVVFNILVIAYMVILMFPTQEVNEELKVDKENEIETSSQKVEAFATSVSQVSKVKFSFVGDVMVHGPQLNAQYDSKSKKYSFENNFQYIKKYIEGSDVAVCNLETTLAGIDKGGYTSFPRFNSPDEIALDLKNAGFDIFCIANNHMIDKGMEGLKRTMNVLEGAKVPYVGAVKSKEDRKYFIMNKNNIKIGISSFTYEKVVNKADTLNGNVIPASDVGLINTIDYDRLGSDLEKMKSIIDQMRSEGAECIIFEIHWGNEYEDNPNKYQQAIVEYLCRNGVDVIVGNHPHVLQQFDTIEREGKTTHVFYSVGNFLSNQRFEILKQRKSENGIIINFEIIKDEKGKIEVSNFTYVPTWISKYFKNGKWVYEILPLNEPFENFDLSYKDNKWRAENALKTIGEVISKGSMKIEMVKD